MKAEDFILSDARTAARILALGSLTSIEKLLASEGIPMSQMIGDVELDRGVLRTDLVRAYGGALGVTAKGHVDFESEKLNVTGTIVPAYSINSILGEIPLLGALFVGGKGEGVLAMTYNVGGTFSEPQVDINALSALAPGFLRGLLAGKGDGEKAAATPDEWSKPRQK